MGELGSIPGSGRLLEKRMTTHSSIVVWRIPWTDEPGRLQSIGSQSVGRDWDTKTSSRKASNLTITKLLIKYPQKLYKENLKNRIEIKGTQT